MSGLCLWYKYAAVIGPSLDFILRRIVRSTLPLTKYIILAAEHKQSLFACIAKRYLTSHQNDYLERPHYHFCQPLCHFRQTTHTADVRHKDRYKCKGLAAERKGWSKVDCITTHRQICERPAAPGWSDQVCECATQYQGCMDVSSLCWQGIAMRLRPE